MLTCTEFVMSKYALRFLTFNFNPYPAITGLTLYQPREFREIPASVTFRTFEGARSPATPGTLRLCLKNARVAPSAENWRWEQRGENSDR